MQATHRGDVGHSSLTAGANQQLAQPFTTGETAEQYNLRSVLIHTGVGDGGPGNLVVAIHESDGDSVGAMVGVPLRGEIPPITSRALNEFRPASGIELEPNTTYFVVASAPNASTSGQNFYNWTLTSESELGAVTEETGSSGWSIGDRLFIKGSDAWTRSSVDGALSMAVIADVSLRLKLRVFLESALP